MGDENSLAGRTQAHKHSAVSSDGGFLEQGVTGFEGGVVGQRLQQAATEIPTWATPSSGLWNSDGTDSGDKASLNVSGMTGRDITHIFYQVEPSTISTSEYPRMRVNSQNVNYDCCIVNQYVTGGSPDVEWNQTATGFFLGHEDGHTSEYQYIGDIYLYKGIGTQASTGMFMTLRGLTYRNDSSQMSYIIYGGGYQPDDSAITDISFTMTSGNISGKIQVTSMDYQ